MGYRQNRKNIKMRTLSKIRNKFNRETSYISKRTRSKKNWHLYKRYIQIKGRIIVHRVKPSPELDITLEYLYNSYRTAVYKALKLLEERVQIELEDQKHKFDLEKYQISVFGGWRMIKNNNPKRTYDFDVSFTALDKNGKQKKLGG